MLKKILQISLLLLIFIGPISVYANDNDSGTGTVCIESCAAAAGISPGDVGFDWIGLAKPPKTVDPVSEVINLEQSGSLGSPYIASLTETYDFITSITWTLTFEDSALDLDSKFAGGSALTNGINVYYDGSSLLDNNNITINNDFSKQEFSAYGFVVYYDGNIWYNLIAKWVYLEEGLQILGSDRTLEIYIQDDMSSLATVTEFSITIEGYTRFDYGYFEQLESVYPNDMNRVQLKNLIVGTDYSVYVNSSIANDVSFWVNFTALVSNPIIEFVFDTASANMLNFYLYETNSNYFLQQFSVPIKPANFDFVALLTDNAVIFLVVVGFIIFIWFLLSGKGKKMVGKF